MTLESSTGERLVSFSVIRVTAGHRPYQAGRVSTGSVAIDENCIVPGRIYRRWKQDM